MDYIKDINAPSLSANEQTICEGRLTLKEIYEALSNLPSNKTPVNDGLSREFYLGGSYTWLIKWKRTYFQLLVNNDILDKITEH